MSFADIWRSDALWIVENHRLHDNDTTTGVGERWDTRDDDGWLFQLREESQCRFLPWELYTNTLQRTRGIHSFRPPSRNSCTCSARGESGESAEFSRMLLPLPFSLVPVATAAPSRSIWEYDRARASRQNPANSCRVFSRENNPDWLRTCLYDPLHRRDNGISVVAAPSPAGVRALITHEDYVANLRSSNVSRKCQSYECQG